MKKILVLIFVISGLLVYAQTSRKRAAPIKMKIKLIIGNSVVNAVLYDNPTARDLFSLLPLKIRLDDYAGIEKVSQLPRKISIKNAPTGSDPAVGDITYYAPWGNLAIFYKDFRYAKGLVVLGKIVSGIDVLKNLKGPVMLTIEKVK